MKGRTKEEEERATGVGGKAGMSGDSETRGKEESRRDWSVMSEKLGKIRSVGFERLPVASESSFRGMGKRKVRL